ncbi:MAG: hypothetical protein HQL86_02055 [Magnetococcales bacterium]|nr:hypothetical protein [Magnetococcales bacterium]
MRVVYEVTIEAGFPGLLNQVYVFSDLPCALEFVGGLLERGAASEVVIVRREATGDELVRHFGEPGEEMAA